MRTTLFAIVALAGSAGAQITLETEAFVNATVQPSGPRTGSSGTRFFNIEGSDNGSFASYGATRFDIAGIKAQFDAAYGAGNWQVDAVDLKLTQSNASFTRDGAVEVYFSSNDSVSLANDGSSPVRWDGANLPSGLDGNFQQVELLAGYNFVEVSTGFVEVRSLSLGAAFLNDILTDSTVTMVLTPNDAPVAATYAGITNSTYAGPTLSITASLIPAPGAAALAGFGGLLAARRRR